MRNRGAFMIVMKRFRKIEVDGLGACIQIDLVIAEIDGPERNIYCMPYSLRYVHDAMRNTGFRGGE